MEEAALAEKPWQLMGEVTGTTRPENSLLQEDLEYDQATRLGLPTLFVDVCITVKVL
jgi:U3 small nucleolar RNA-associated protein MPP10